MIQTTKVVDPTICDCDCHGGEDSRVISTCPHCCDVCPKCDLRVAAGMMRRHLRKHCRVENKSSPRLDLPP